MMVSSLQAVPVHRSTPDREADVRIIDPLNGDDWDEKVSAHKGCSIFHLSAWARVLAGCYGHRPFYLEVASPDAPPSYLPLMEVRSFLTGRRGVSVPFADFAGPLMGREDQEDQEDQIVEAATRLGRERGWKHTEIRGGLRPSGRRPAFRSYIGHELVLTDGLDSVWRRLRPSTRRSVKKGEASGLTVSSGCGKELMEAYFMLHCRTRKRHGLPPQPTSFFNAIRRELLVKGKGQIVVSYQAGKPVAGAIFLHAGRSAIYKFGASDERYWQDCPNHLVMWRAIEYLYSIGCDSLHFGRTSMNDRGLNRFKESWGCAQGSLHYFRKQTADSAWVGEGRPQKESHPFIFGHLPTSVNRVAGCLIYPHLD